MSETIQVGELCRFNTKCFQNVPNSKAQGISVVTPTNLLTIVSQVGRENPDVFSNSIKRCLALMLWELSIVWIRFTSLMILGVF